MNSISAIEFNQLDNLEQLHIIDVRFAVDFELRHIPTAINIPLEELPEQLDQLSKDIEYYIICKAGVRSVKACTLLQDLGYKTINVEGGMVEWKNK